MVGSAVCAFRKRVIHGVEARGHRFEDFAFSDQNFTHNHLLSLFAFLILYLFFGRLNSSTLAYNIAHNDNETSNCSSVDDDSVGCSHRHSL